MRITESTLRKIIREELNAAKAEKQILAGIGANAPLMIKRGIPAFAKKVAAGEMTVKQVVNKLRASIREAEGMDEANGDFRYGSMSGDRFLDVKPRLKVAADVKAAIGVKLGGPSPRASNDLDAIMAHYRMGPARDEFDESVNAILRGESNADAEAAKLKDAFEQRMFKPKARRASYARR